MTAEDRFGGSEARALAWCLEAMEREGLSAEECLRHFPGLREELEPLLAMATLLQNFPHVAPSVAFRRTARQRLVRQLRLRQSMGSGTSLLIRVTSIALAPLRLFFRAAPVWGAVAALALCALTGTGLAFASNTALPGDVLYPVKTTLEEARLAISPDEPETVRLHLDFAERRVGEILILHEARRFEDIPEPLQDFEDHVVRSSEILAQVVADEDPQARTLAEQILADLDQHADTLYSIQEAIPDEDKEPLRQTIALTQAHGSFAEWLLTSGIEEPLPSEGEEIPPSTTIFCWPEELSGMAPEGIPTCAPGEGPWIEPTYSWLPTGTPEGEPWMPVPEDLPTPDEAEASEIPRLPSPFPIETPAPTSTPAPDQADTSLHVADLDAGSYALDAYSWEATVLMIIHDGGHRAVEGVQVSGLWLDYASGFYQYEECFTDAEGRCSFLSEPVPGPFNVLSFMVLEVYQASRTYNSLENHDPDGDSDGSMILVPSP